VPINFDKEFLLHAKNKNLGLSCFAEERAYAEGEPLCGLP
jgi:hypothetical protein